MDWGQFWTIIAQVAIAASVVLTIYFIAAIIVAVVKEKSKEDR